jgi:hypothetical protein
LGAASCCEQAARAAIASTLAANISFIPAPHILSATHEPVWEG